MPLPSDVPCTNCNDLELLCEHYEERVEQLLQCGNNGFALAYGKEHCRIIQELRSNATLPQWILDWMLSHEKCLQQRVLELATARACPTPNPVSCLQFEAAALRAFEECFTRNVSLLCESSEIDTNAVALANHIHNLTDKLGINNYYRHEVLEAVTRAVKTCNHSDIGHVVNSVEPSSANRVVFCAIVTPGNENDERDFSTASYVSKIARILNRPEGQFQYAGVATEEATQLCLDNAPAALGNIQNPVFHHVIWKPDNDDALLNTLQPKVVSISPSTYFDFYELEDWRSYGHCGDGERQAGELCDTGLSNFFEHGCNSSCMPCDQYECDTEPFVQSMCRPTVCGDGFTTSNEECDVGNVFTSNEGIGCADCQVATGYKCNNTYNATSTCWRLPTVPPSPTTDEPTTSLSPDSTATTRTLTTATTSTRNTGATPFRPIGKDSATQLNCFQYWILLGISLMVLISR